MGPYFIVNMMDAEAKKYSETIHKLVTWLAFSTNAVNPIIYAFVNKQFRDGYAAILTCHNSQAQHGATTHGEPTMPGAHAPTEQITEVKKTSDTMSKT
jgi:hypothetical protein